MFVFPSTLIIAKNHDSVTNKIKQICQSLNQQFNINNPDLFIINQESGWGINQIRQITNFISQKPFSHQNKIIVILDAHNLNIESQNALLKTLEEPGNNNFIVIATNKIQNLLPTIISRCHTIKISESFKFNNNKYIEITGNLLKDLTLSEKIGKNKEEVLPILQNELYLYQQNLLKKPNIKNKKTIEKIIQAIQMINANVDPRSALDFIFLS